MSGRQDPTRWSTVAPAELSEAFVKAARGYCEQGPSAEQHAEMWRKLEGSVGHAVGKAWYAGWAGAGIVAIAAVWMGWSIRSGMPLMAAGARAVFAPSAAADAERAALGGGSADEQSRLGGERMAFGAALALNMDESSRRGAENSKGRVDPRGAALGAPLTAAGSDGAERQGSMTGVAGPSRRAREAPARMERLEVSGPGTRPPMAAGSQGGPLGAEGHDRARARSPALASDRRPRPLMAAASQAGQPHGAASVRSSGLASDAASLKGPLRAEARGSGHSISGRVALAHEHAAKSPPTAAAPEELQLLLQARRLLRTNPERALELAERHRAEYPRGTFVEERELLAIEALRGLGRGELAAARAVRFHAQFPGSPHARRVDALSGRE